MKKYIVYAILMAGTTLVAAAVSWIRNHLCTLSREIFIMMQTVWKQLY